jgi:hypothetical protein
LGGLLVAGKQNVSPAIQYKKAKYVFLLLNTAIPKTVFVLLSNEETNTFLGIEYMNTKNSFPVIEYMNTKNSFPVIECKNTNNYFPFYWIKAYDKQTPRIHVIEYQGTRTYVMFLNAVVGKQKTKKPDVIEFTQ